MACASTRTPRVELPDPRRRLPIERCSETGRPAGVDRAFGELVIAARAVVARGDRSAPGATRADAAIAETVVLIVRVELKSLRPAAV